MYRAADACSQCVKPMQPLRAANAAIACSRCSHCVQPMQPVGGPRNLRKWISGRLAGVHACMHASACGQVGRQACMRACA
eukprot:354189-Chlamydomonas_euryale.AAC.3